jgi:hypothetical protein
VVAVAVGGGGRLGNGGFSGAAHSHESREHVQGVDQRRTPPFVYPFWLLWPLSRAPQSPTVVVDLRQEALAGQLEGGPVASARLHASTLDAMASMGTGVCEDAVVSELSGRRAS